MSAGFSAQELTQLDQGGIRYPTLHGDAPWGNAHLLLLYCAGAGDREICQSYRLAFHGQWPWYAGHPDAEVSTELRPDGLRHGRGTRLAHRAVLLHDLHRDAVSQVHLLAIGHHPAFEIGGAVGDFGDTVNQIPAGTVFHGCQGQATLREECASSLLRGVVIVPPDIRGQPRHNGLFDGFDHGVRRGDIARPGDHAEMDAIGFRIDAQVGVLVPEEFGNAFIHCRLRESHGFDIPGDGDVARDQLAQAWLYLLVPHR